jgi:hypothetical protein
VKREEAKQGLSLHDVRMNGLTIRGVIRTGDAERIDCHAPMQRSDVIRRRWNNLESIKDRAESHDEWLSRLDDRDIVRSVSPGLRRLRPHQNALRAREAITGVTSLERTPASILYSTIPCANKMLAITPIRKRRFSITLCPNTQFSSRIANG